MELGNGPAGGGLRGRGLLQIAGQVVLGSGSATSGGVGWGGGYALVHMCDVLFITEEFFSFQFLLPFMETFKRT